LAACALPYAGLLRLQPLLRATTGSRDDAVVSVRRLQDDNELADDYRATLKDVRNRGEARIVLDCDWHKVRLVLQQVYLTQREVTRHRVVSVLDRGVVGRGRGCTASPHFFRQGRRVPHSPHFLD